ncbi:MAG: Smr/MutS family protein [Desulfovibrio sp.]|nr:Smr/MutS family protein [Desulfovibrio sp.]
MIHPRTLQALEFPKITSLLASFCHSQEGREIAQRTAPLAHMDEAEEALALFADALVWFHDSDAARLFAPTGFADISPMLRKLSGSRFIADIDAFWALRSVLNQAKQAMQALTLPASSQKWPRLLAHFQETQLPRELFHALNRCISDDAQLKDESSPELFRLRQDIRSLHQNCLRKVHDFAARYNILPYLQDEFMTISQDRYVLPLKATYKGRLQGILHDWSQTGETCYFEPMFLVELNNRLQELRREEREEEMQVLGYLTGLLRTEREAVDQALSLLTALDLLQAKGKLSEALDGQCVHFTAREQGLELLEARHPLLALQAKDAKNEQKRAVRPLNILLRPDDRCLLISGSNAAGKTVCLKTLGLICAMAASGLPVPAAPGSHLFWPTRLDAFIGDEQDIEDHVSTFTAQITHLSKAWKYLGPGSLVLLDEFGAGTDPTQGAALAQAVLDALLERGACVLSATHFPSLKIWALSTEHVRAASMLFDPQSLRPLFRLAYDQVGQSQTLTVARDHGLAPEILERAQNILLLGAGDTTAQIDRLNQLAVEREAELEQLIRLQKKTKDEAVHLKERLHKERERLQTEISGHIQQLMQDVHAEKLKNKEALNRLKQLRRDLSESTQAQEAQPAKAQDFANGMRVRHKGLGKIGTITDTDPKRERLRLDLGGISLWARASELEALASAQRQLQTSSSQAAAADLGFSLMVDVRGMTASEARSAVQRFLDNHLVGGPSCVEIIHGRGTGVLRRELHSYLDKYPGIDHYELAPEDQGGCGKTIVYFS